jgi:hypothetical protein
MEDVRVCFLERPQARIRRWRPHHRPKVRPAVDQCGRWQHVTGLDPAAQVRGNHHALDRFTFDIPHRRAGEALLDRELAVRLSVDLKPAVRLRPP